MVEIKELINDEIEAIENYRNYLKHHAFSSPSQVHKIKRILEDEERHLRELRKL